MAEAFLRQLLQNHNRVDSDEEQKCVICLEECRKMNQETGLIELAIRLPACKHVVGSGCISQWLRSNNTCPIWYVISDSILPLLNRTVLGVFPL